MAPVDRKLTISGVDPAGDLQDPAAQHHRDEAAAHLGHVGGQAAEAGAEAAQQIQRHGQLHQQLQGAAGDRAPGGGGGQRVALAAGRPGNRFGPALQHQRGDDGRVPQHRGDVGQEEAAVAVQHAQAPGRQHQDARCRETGCAPGGCRPRASRRGTRRRTRPPAAAPPARPPAPAATRSAPACWPPPPPPAGPPPPASPPSAGRRPG